MALNDNHHSTIGIPQYLSQSTSGRPSEREMVTISWKATQDVGGGQPFDKLLYTVPGGRKLHIYHIDAWTDNSTAAGGEEFYINDGTSYEALFKLLIRAPGDKLLNNMDYSNPLIFDKGFHVRMTSMNPGAVYSIILNVSGVLI